MSRNTVIFSKEQINERNDLLCRNHLSRLEADGAYINNVTVAELKWFRIKGLNSFWVDHPQEYYAKVFENILSGITKEGCKIAFLVSGTNKGISFYVGCTSELFDAIKGSYYAYMPGIDINDIDSFDDIKICSNYSGIIVGHPGESADPDVGVSVPLTLQIDDFCRGMLGTEFSFMVVATRQSELMAQIAMQSVTEEMFICSDQINYSQTGIGGVERKLTNYHMQKYFDNLTLYLNFINDCVHKGIWSTNIYYMANDKTELSRLKGVLRGVYSSDSRINFESIHCIDINSDTNELFRQVPVLTDADEQAHLHPFYLIGQDYNIPFYKSKFQTHMDSRMLSIFIRLPQNEYAGYYVDSYVEFDSTVRKKAKENQKELLIGNITYPGRNVVTKLENRYSIELDDLTRHALIIGITGGGKTNTSKSLLRELWIKNKIPFLVIESAKREYWELINITGENMLSEGIENPQGFQQLNLFTLGWEAEKDSVKYRINPFEAAKGVSLQTHIDYLLATFKAAFELYSPMPYVLESAVYEVYYDRGWDIVNSVNIYGRTEYPTLTDLYYKIDTVTDSLGYNAEVRSNVKAALKARINSLRIGGKGAMLDTPKSLDIGKLLETPTVFELEDLGDDDTKAFVIGILLVQLYEYRKADRSAGGKSLKSVLMIEEAHRLLKNVPEGSGDNSRAKSVEFFCNMLAEIRSYGQGIIIADQVPTKLASDTIKNTNLKIVHRTVMMEDREAIGKAMNMTDSQIEYISSLPRGCAAVFAEGDSRPKLVKFPLVVPEKDYKREEALRIIKGNVQNVYGQDYDIKYDIHYGCSFCEKRGIHCQMIRKIVESDKVKSYIKKSEAILKGSPFNMLMINKIINQHIKDSRTELSVDEKICLFGFLSDQLMKNDSEKMNSMVTYTKKMLRRGN